MNTTWFQRLVLAAAGLIALGIGSAIVISPAAFYAGYGIRLGTDPNLLSELRAPGASLMILGAIIFAGAVLSSWSRISAIVGTAVFSAYAFGRLIGMTADGMPRPGLVEAAIIEIGLGALCAMVLMSKERAFSRSRRGASDAFVG